MKLNSNSTTDIFLRALLWITVILFLGYIYVLGITLKSAFFATNSWVNFKGSDFYLMCMDMLNRENTTSITISLILLFIVCVLALLAIYSIAKELYMQLLTYRIVKRLHILSTKDRIHLYYDDKPGAFTYGIVNPRIYVSLWTVEQLTACELEAVLLHEYKHLYSRDTFLKSITNIIASSVPFLSKFQIFDAYLEASADRFVAENMNSNKYTVSGLIKFMKYPSDSKLYSTVGYSTKMSRVDLLANVNQINTMLFNLFVPFLTTSVLLVMLAGAMNFQSNFRDVYSLDSTYNQTTGNTCSTQNLSRYNQAVDVSSVELLLSPAVFSSQR